MDDKKELENFDLDDILNEFHDLPQEDVALDGFTADLSDILGGWDQPAAEEPAPESSESPSSDTIRMQALGSRITPKNKADASPEDPESAEDAVPKDTIRMTELISQIAAENEKSQAVSEDATIRMDVLELHRDADPENGAQEPPSEPTIRMEIPGAEVPDAPVEEAEGPEGTEESSEPFQEEPPHIIYNPRTRLRELKKKLVAGPEKRYYALSEIGVGRVQVSILLNLILVGLCVAVTTLFALGMISGNRLRFVIFSQILAMLLSALLGCQQMLDGIGDLFKGRFTLNTLLAFTFVSCCADAVFCLSELRIPCCAAFSLEVTMAQWAHYQRISTEMAQMDTLRKAVRLNAMVKTPDYYNGKPGILRREGEVEDFMDHYQKASGPEMVQRVYAFLSFLICIGIAVYSGMNHGVSMALQILSTSLLVAVPASFFVALTRPASLMQRRLHMVGTVFCGWRGVKQLCGKAAFPLQDNDLFPVNTTKLNGVKYYGDRNPDEILSYSTSLISAAGGGLVSVFRQMLSDRDGREYPTTNFRYYSNGGVGGEICGEPVLLGSLDFLQDMDVTIPEGTMVSQAVYVAIDGELCAVFAIAYAKMRSSAAGLISLCGSRKVTPVLIGDDFMLTASLLRAKFSVNTRRILFPEREERKALAAIEADGEAPALALATRDDLAAYAYAVSGARALRAASRLGTAIHLIGGILGMLIMAALAILGNTELLTPVHILLYQLIWMVPGLLITEWARTA